MGFNYFVSIYLLICLSLNFLKRMISLIYLTFLILGIIFFNIIFKKYKILLSHSGDKHQEYVEKESIPMIGGIFLILTFLFCF